MIRSFRSKALKQFWERSDDRKLPDEHLGKITRILDALEAALSPRTSICRALPFTRSRAIGKAGMR